MENKNTFIGENGLLHCSVCGEALETVFDKPFMGLTKHSRMCSCKRENYELMEEKLKRQGRQLMRDKCFMSRTQHSWTFANDNGCNPKMEIAKDYVKNWREMKKKRIGLLLWGPVGSGKSYMAACIANALIDEGAEVKMTNFSTIINDLYSCEDKNEYVKALCRYDLLIIDDLGIERSTEFVLENVFNVIDARYVSGKPMIITTNLSINELKNQKDLLLKRVNDRVLERCVPVCVSGNDFRKVKSLEAKDIFRDIIMG